MKKLLLALALGGAAGIAAKAIADKKKKKDKEDDCMICNLSESESETNSMHDELYKHLPEGVVISNVLDLCIPGQALEESQLREGEMFASIYKVGCYSVRIAVRAYREGNFESESDDNNEFKGKGTKYGEAVTAQSAEIPPLNSKYYRPATSEELVKVNDELNNGFMRIMGMRSIKGYRLVKEVSAAYMGGEYKNICHTMYPKGCAYTDNITFIGTVKISNSTPDNRASLFVGQTFVGDSYSVDDWHAFSPNGQLRCYRIHGMDTDSWEAKCNWNG